MGLCSGHRNSVVIRELSLYPQSLLAKLSVMRLRNHVDNRCLGWSLRLLVFYFQSSTECRFSILWHTQRKDVQIHWVSFKSGKKTAKFGTGKFPVHVPCDFFTWTESRTLLQVPLHYARKRRALSGFFMSSSRIVEHNTYHWWAITRTRAWQHWVFICAITYSLLSQCVDYSLTAHVRSPQKISG